MNFLRFDALTNKQKGTVQDRVLKGVKEPQRGTLSHLTADEIVDRFTWTELVALISREWPLFDRIFSDKAQFTLHSSIINDRFDAHAKDADRADVANYRRSLNWLDARITNI